MSVVITEAIAKIFKKETSNLIVGWAYTNCRNVFFNDKKKTKSNVNSNAFMTQKATYIGYFVA